jgi:hypothetical protein
MWDKWKIMEIFFSSSDKLVIVRQGRTFDNCRWSVKVFIYFCLWPESTVTCVRLPTHVRHTYAIINCKVLTNKQISRTDH